MVGMMKNGVMISMWIVFWFYIGWFKRIVSKILSVIVMISILLIMINVV